jgi:hypothetical protein
MQILYITCIVAVFVLCLALLSTARRILGSSPLASGQLGIAGVPMEAPTFHESRMDSEPVQMRSALAETAYDAPYIPLDESMLTAREAKVFAAPETAETLVAASEEEPLRSAEVWAASETATPETAACETPASEMPASATPTAEVPVAEIPETVTQAGPRRSYNYALECLLLGLSAWILIQTQRDTLRVRAGHSSRDRVA